MTCRPLLTDCIPLDVPEGRQTATSTRTNFRSGDIRCLLMLLSVRVGSTPRSYWVTES